MVHLLVTCWTSLGFWGCLVFSASHSFLLLGTPGTGGSQTPSKTATFSGWKMVHLLLTCWDSWDSGDAWFSAPHYLLLLGAPGTYGTTESIGMLEQCLYISPLLLHSCTCICFCGANYILFQWVHEAFCLCCPLNKWCWAHNIGFPMPSIAKN